MRPWQILQQGMPPPSEYDPSVEDKDYFYRNFTNPLIEPMIRLMDTGIHIDQDAVEDLRNTVQSVLEDVDKKLSANPLIKEFREAQYKIKYKQYLDEMETKKKPLSHFIKPYKPDNMVHRTYLVNHILELQGLEKYKLDKWSVTNLKKFLEVENTLELVNVINKVSQPKLESEAMLKLAEDKMGIYNKSHYSDRIASKAFDDIVPKFNASSSKQKAELLSLYLGYEANTMTEGGMPQWNRFNIELILKEETDEDRIEILQCFIDHSYSAIIQNNFIEAFDRYTIDNVLHGNVKLLGTKSGGRLTSNNPNLLNAPSTGSIYAKPLKKCFTAPDDMIIYTVDLNALEDRVLASLTLDKGKVALQENPELDGHIYNACGYYSDEVESIIGSEGSIEDKAIRFKTMMEDGNKQLKEIRQRGKAVTFKLAYGGMPDEHKGGAITEEIYNNYHNVLYPGVKDYTDNYVLKSVINNRYIHLGFGCRLYSDNPEQDIRTLHNATVQFFSIMSLIAIHEIYHRIEENNLKDSIKIHATIYDSIYFYVKKDPEIIKWLNNNIVDCLTIDFMENQRIHNECEGEIGLSWAELEPIKNNATSVEIQNVINELFIN